MSDESSEKDLLSKNIIGIIFLVFVAVVGSIGNFNTVLVYATRYKRSNHRIFIIFLGITDLTSCLFIVPFDLYRLLNQGGFPDLICDFINVNRFLSIASLSLLGALAYERFRKLCRPLKWQLRNRHSVMCSLFILCITFFFFFIPSPFMYGVVRNEFIIRGMYINISECSIMTEFKNSPLEIAYNILLLTFGTVLLTVNVVSYGFLLRLFWRKGLQLYALKKTTKHSSGSCSTTQTDIGSNNATESVSGSGSAIEAGSGPDSATEAGSGPGIATEAGSGSCSATEVRFESDSTKKACSGFVSKIEGGSGSGITAEGNIGSRKRTKVRITPTNMRPDRYNRARRLTFVFLVATVGSYFCALVTLLFSLFNEDEILHYDVVASLKQGYEVLYNFNYVNHVLNPIVYCFMDNVFRKRLKSIYKSVIHKICG